MSDLFHESLSDEAIAAVFGIMAAAPRQTFQVLTKRAARMREWFQWIGASLPGSVEKSAIRGCALAACKELRGSTPKSIARIAASPFDAPAWPLPNVWLGVSVEDQATADERIPILLATPAAVRFVSYEPALGPVDLRAVPYQDGNALFVGPMGGLEWAGAPRQLLSWLIAGGESGPGARPCHVEWIRSAVKQCKDAGVPVFVKQLGAKPIDTTNGENRESPGTLKHALVAGMQDSQRMKALKRIVDRKGGEPSEWPEDLRVREFPLPPIRIIAVKPDVVI